MPIEMPRAPKTAALLLAAQLARGDFRLRGGRRTVWRNDFAAQLSRPRIPNRGTAGYQTIRRRRAPIEMPRTPKTVALLLVAQLARVDFQLRRGRRIVWQNDFAAPLLKSVELGHPPAAHCGRKIRKTAPQYSFRPGIRHAQVPERRARISPPPSQRPKGASADWYAMTEKPSWTSAAALGGKPTCPGQRGTPNTPRDPVFRTPRGGPSKSNALREESPEAFGPRRATRR